MTSVPALTETRRTYTFDEGTGPQVPDIWNRITLQLTHVIVTDLHDGTCKVEGRGFPVKKNGERDGRYVGNDTALTSAVRDLVPELGLVDA